MSLCNEAVFRRQRKKKQTIIDLNSRTKEERDLVSAEGTYKVAALATNYGVPPNEAGLIINGYGPSQKKNDAHLAARDA